MRKPPNDAGVDGPAISPKAAARAERLAQQLRANLKRRKAAGKSSTAVSSAALEDGEEHRDGASENGPSDV